MTLDAYYEQKILSSPEFRAFILRSVELKTLPSPVLVLMMELVWGKP